MILESGADVPRPKQRRGPSTRAGSIRSTVRQSHSAKVRLVQLACPECPWRTIECDDGAINAIPVSDHVARSPVPRKRLRYLTCNPFCRRIPCDVDPDEVSAV